MCAVSVLNFFTLIYMQVLKNREIGNSHLKVCSLNAAGGLGKNCKVN